MLQNSPNSVVAYYMIGSLLLLLLVVAIVTYAFLHQKKVIQLRNLLHEEEIRNQQAVFNALQEGEANERTRLAEELHDGIGARLSGLKMNLEYLKNNSGEHQALITKIFSGISETLEEVRIISHNLQNFYFSNKDLESLLQGYTEQLSSLNGCRYDLFMNSPVVDIDNNIKLQCYRIITELLNNIHKHAKASVASVQINIEDEQMEIVVEDNGVGMRSNGTRTEGIGLVNIGNRVKVCRGIMNLDSSEKGTTVIVEIPLNPVI